MIIVEFSFSNFMDLFDFNYLSKLSYFNIIGFICLVTIHEKRKFRSLNFLNMKMGKNKNKNIYIYESYLVFSCYHY